MFWIFSRIFLLLIFKKIIFSVPSWPPYYKMVSPPRTYPYKSSITYYLLHTTGYQIHYKMSATSGLIQPSCSLLLSSEPTTALTSQAICNLDDTEWDKLTRSDMAGKLLEYLDNVYDKNNGNYIVFNNLY